MRWSFQNNSHSVGQIVQHTVSVDEIERNEMEGNVTVIDQEQMIKEEKKYCVQSRLDTHTTHTHTQTTREMPFREINTMILYLLSVRQFDAKCNKYVKYRKEE